MRATEEVLLDFSALPSGCDLAHRGLFVDLGEPSDRSVRVRGPKNIASRYDAVEHERSTYAKVTGTELSVQFLGPDEAWPHGTPLVVEPKLLGGGARAVTVVVNGKVAGRTNLTRGQIKQASFTTSDIEILPGQNELSLRFPPQAARGNDVAAEIDWVRIGPPDEDGPYAPPTRAQVTGSFKIDNQLLRGFLLRAPGHVRCIAEVRPGARVRARVGVLGEGQAEVRVVAVRDREPPAVLGSVLAATDSAAPDGTAVKATGVVPIDFEVPAGHSLTTLRFELTRASKGVRVALGEPRLVAAPEATPAAHRSQVTVLVVFGGLPRRFFTREGVVDEPAFNKLVDHALIVPDHRGNSALSGTALAAMLTGTVDHGVAAGCKLSPTTVVLSEALRDAGIRSALFTANPWSTAAHGFDRGFATYEAVLPGDGQPGTKVFELAQNFLQHHTRERSFVVIHARGGHPPWDIGREVLKELPPQNYPGGLDPRHAGELLARARAIPPGVRFTDADRERMWAMHKVALHDSAEAFGQFYTTITRLLEREGNAKSTWILTGDVALDESGAVPFGDGEVLNEPPLYPGLFVLAPDLTPRTSGASTQASMLAAAVLGSFGLAPPQGFAPDALAAADREIATASPLRFAELERRSIAELDHFAWIQQNGDFTRFCDLNLEVQCPTDVRSAYPLASYALAQRTRTFSAARRVPRCIPADLDATMQSAIHAWGRR